MKIVLDAAGILNFKNLPDRQYHTTVEIRDELKDMSSKALFEARRIKTTLASEKNIEKVKQAAEKPGDIEKLSKADISVIALCLDLKDCILITDDYAVQNMCTQ